MGYQRKFKLLFVLLLVAGIFVNSAWAEACFCGQACLHGFQPKSKVTSSFHMRCPGTLCKGCSWEKSTTPAAQPPDVPSFITAFTLPALRNRPFTNDAHTEICFFHVSESIPSLPHYLKNLTLLC